MKSEWKKIDKKIIDELFNDNFDENLIRREFHLDFQYAKWKANHLGGLWEDYMRTNEAFDLKIFMLEDLGYIPTDLI